MSHSTKNDDHVSTDNDNYGQEHKLKLEQVGDKLKSAIGKNSDDSHESSGEKEKHGSHDASGRDNDSYRSFGQDQKTYDQDSFGAGNDDTFGSPNTNKETYGKSDEGFGGRSGNTYLASGDNHQSSADHESEFGSTGNQPEFSENDYNASAQSGPNRGNDFSEDSAIGEDTYGSGRNRDESATSNEFGSARSHDHDYENPRKGFGSTGGGGDSYGLGYVEN